MTPGAMLLVGPSVTVSLKGRSLTKTDPTKTSTVEQAEDDGWLALEEHPPNWEGRQRLQQKSPQSSWTPCH